jgi:adenine phosphoribosyltransferase
VVEHAGFVISLPKLGGEKKLTDSGVTSFSICEFEGE